MHELEQFNEKTERQFVANEGPVGTSEISLDEIEGHSRKKYWKTTRRKRLISPRYKYVDVLRNTHLLRIIFMLFCGGVSYYGITFIFPVLALELGSTKFYSSLTVLVAGGCEVISKLAVGVLTDSKILSKHTISVLLFLLAGTGAVVTAHLHNAEVLDKVSIYTRLLSWTKRLRAYSL